jgi:hypothetical protein
MSSFKRFLEEAEYASRHPIPGDQFDIVLASGRLIETRVVKLVDDGFVVESLQARSGEQDSDSPIPGQDGKEDQELTGRMSPINGHAFTDYDINKNPRKWFTRAGTPPKVKHKQVTLMGVPGPLSESCVYVRDAQGTEHKTKWRFVSPNK